MRRVLIVAPWVALVVLGAVAVGDLVYATLLDVQESLPIWEIGLNLVLRLIPVVLLVVAAALAIEVVEEEVQKGQMTKRVRQLLFWMPRLAIMIFIALVSLLSLDVFGQGYSLWETLLALLVHLIPTGVMLLALAIAWRHEWVGGIFFLAWALLYVATARGFPIGVYLSMAGLPFMLGVLLLLNWRFKGELRHEGRFRTHGTV
jgi:hypothetical protein